MERFGRFVVKFKHIILITAVILLIPAAIGYIGTRVNYDLLYYLPDGIDTMTGQDILMEDFNAGAFSMVVIEDMDYKNVSKLKEKIEGVEHVSKVLWYDSFVDINIPPEMIPKSLYDVFNADNSTLMMVIFDDTSSGDGTMNAIENIREITKKQCFISGISAIITDTKALSEHETPIYVLLAVIISIIVMSIMMDSFLVPLLFLLSIGMAIVYNLGSNFVFGEISYVTKALAAVLQLGVTMDYSIFLWHSYEEQRGICSTKEDAMAKAIASTIVSVVGSSITTVAGFIALCFMSFTLGLDLGIVMAKGVLFGVIGCVTILPSMILIFDRALEKTKHKSLIPEFKKLPGIIIKLAPVFVIIMLALSGPAIYGYNNTDVYYDLTLSLPKTLDSVVATDVLKEQYNLSSASIVLIDRNLEAKKVVEMVDEMKEIDGVSSVLAMESITKGEIPEAFLPDKLVSELKSDSYEMVVLTSEYKTGSDEANDQCGKIENVIKKYDSDGMLVGEAACTRDLIDITDADFKRVSAVSIGVIFLIIAIIYLSPVLPVLLVLLIEFAIFVNMAIPCYTNTVIPFIASIVIGTIQLGATVDYAILMTTRYRTERYAGVPKKEAVKIALETSIPSIIASAVSFFGATFGVGVYSSIDMISALCLLMARGAVISMISVICLLPAMFMIFDKVIMKTSLKRMRKHL
ncbi:MAG: MMPL family transporter [Lachnospiraceae bacterium]|nr:MMPL family transporter [Lachnospiraceae bacterium]